MTKDTEAQGSPAGGALPQGPAAPTAPGPTAPGPTASGPEPGAGAAPQGAEGAAAQGPEGAAAQTRKALKGKAAAEPYGQGKGRVAPSPAGGNYAKTKKAAEPPKPGQQRPAQRPLELPVPKRLSEQMGVDFSQVRIHLHTGVAEQHGAQAVAMGKAIHVADSVALDSSEGQRVLAHELTHVVQQNPELPKVGSGPGFAPAAAAKGAPQKRTEGSAGGAAEVQAESTGAAVAAGASVTADAAKQGDDDQSRARRLIGAYATWVEVADTYYGLDAQGLGTVLGRTVALSKPTLARATIELLRWDERDDVAYWLAHALSDTQLHALDGALRRVLIEQMSGGLCGAEEKVEIARLERANSPGGTSAPGKGAEGSAPAPQTAAPAAASGAAPAGPKAEPAEPIAATGTYAYTPNPVSVVTMCSAGSGLDLANATAKKGAVVLDPATLSAALPLVDGAAPPGLELKSGVARLYNGTPLKVLDYDPAGKFAKVEAVGQTWWIEATKVSYGKATLQPPMQLSGARYFGSGADRVAVFPHEGRDVLVACKGNVETFDLTYATPLPGDASGASVLTTSKDSASAAHAYNATDNRKTEANEDNPASFHNGEAAATAKVCSWAAGPTYGADGKPDGGQIDSACVTLQEKTVEARTKLVQVQTFDGRIVWLSASKVAVWGSAFRWSIEDSPAGLCFVKARDADIVEGENLRYPIVREVANLLYAQQTAKADALLAKQTRTPKQDELLAKASAFVKDPSLGKGLRTLAIPGHFLQEDGETLNPDLIQRLNQFYQFLQYAQIVNDGAPSVASGIRGRPTAHVLSVNWTLNTASGHLKSMDQKKSFAQDLLALDRGQDPTANQVWATAEHLSRLQAAQAQLAEEATRPAGEAEISAVVKDIQDTIGKREVKGQMKFKQGAQAAEGYPHQDPNRRPGRWEGGVSNHCGGEAMDITFPFVMNYYDPIIDAIALKFGLFRPVKDSGKSPEHWHYERVGGGAPKSE